MKKVQVPATKVDVYYKCEDCDEPHLYLQFASGGSSLYMVLSDVLTSLISEHGNVEIVTHFSKVELMEVEVPDDAELDLIMQPAGTAH